MVRVSTPVTAGHAERDGVSIAYEVHGTGGTDVVLLPTWSIVHSRFWKAQLGYLARHFRVVVFDGRGSGGSSRPRMGYAARTRSEVRSCRIDPAVCGCCCS